MVRQPRAIVLIALLHVIHATNSLVAGEGEGLSSNGRAVPLVLPVAGTSRLAVQQEGIDLLNGLAGNVSPIIVIGPYRSGKSFTLNQLLRVSCDEGFGVGHTRATETKGIWMWSAPPTKVLPDGRNTSLLYVDTEGFESTGKSNSYDDRVFAVSAVLSSVLIYNLPETIRESDIGKLSFAVELANGLYERYQPAPGASATPAGSGAKKDGQLDAEAGIGGQFEPGAMLWLIQRDFLQGKTASDVVAEALQPVANPSHDPDIEQTNAIRLSLSTIAANSSGYSLVQPHLERTRLCELPDSELDPKYVEQRDGLRHVVEGLARPKVLGGQLASGPQLAVLASRLVDALNGQEIPNAASMLDVFNRDVVAKAVRVYRAALSGLVLPMGEDGMQEVEHQARVSAQALFNSTVVGRKRSQELAVELAESLEREWRLKRNENLAASNELCSDLESRCESELDFLQGMRLPSVRKFNATFAACRATFERRCLGPAHALFDTRLDKALARAQASFNKDYNDRLYTGLLFLLLGAAVFFRFVLHVKLLEGICWLGFIFLELYPHLQISGSMYDTVWWKTTVHVWEALMLALFGFPGEWAVWLALLLGGTAYCMHALRRKGRSRRSKSRSERDLDV